MQDRLSYQEGIPIEANEDETRSNNLYMALLPYLEPTSWPNGDTCPVLEEVQNFENRLWLLPGVPEVRDSEIIEIKFPKIYSGLLGVQMELTRS